MSVDVPRDLRTLTAQDHDLTASVVIDAAMNYALAHNGISPLKAVLIENHSTEPLDALRLEIRLDGPVSGRIAEPLMAALPEIGAGESRELLPSREAWQFDAATFAALDEAVTASVSISFTDSTRALRVDGAMRLLARDEWWALSIQESLAAFVTPRARAIRDVIGEASALLGERTGNPSVDGYQGGTERAGEIAAAVYDAMRAREIRYINPPASFEGTGQKIRSAEEVLVDRWGTCLDTTTTYAAALEHAGLHPVIVVCDGHAFSGHLLDDQQLPELVTRDPRVIVNLVDSGVFVPMETTKICAGSDLSFAEASWTPRSSGWWTDRLADVRCLIDVSNAHRSVRPLPAVHVEGGVRVVEVERQARPAAPAPRAAPSRPDVAESGARGGERREESYPPRVARWRNSLLDLSFRNPLLNMRAGRTSLDLHVPHGSLGAVEDMVFEGRSITVIPHDQIAEIHFERGARTAQDIEAEELAELLTADATVFGACTAAAYVTRMRGIARRARTVTEETGANNLFLTLGTLRWEDSGREARAPLFLVPVTLRGRRGRPFDFQIDDGGYAQPNQCLLEKLRVSRGLRIPEFQDPETDESGIDLAGSLQAIRRAVLDAGLPFTVEETAHLGLLQFSTLQLWQDMTENWESFLANPVVRHLVETPTDSFVDTATEAPSESSAEALAYCPISVDGSQLEAVTWAEAGRSFVLEGPPGTGKSQTITNLIANALAAGQKVLFVAEKQAALDVVQRRLDSVGLGELCLDLHAKGQTPERMRKQLRDALHLRADGNAESWSALRARHQTAVESLDRYPTALHEPGGAGLSAWTARQSLLTAGEGSEVHVPPSTVSAPLDTDEVYRLARDLTEGLFDMGTALGSHPWRLARLSDLDEAEARSELRLAVSALEDAVENLPEGPLRELLDGAPSDEAIGVVRDWLRASAAAGRIVAPDVVEAASTRAWLGQLDVAGRRLATVRRDSASLMAVFGPEAIADVDLDQLLIRAREADGKLFKGKRRRLIVEELAPVIRTSVSVDPATITQTLEALVALRSEAQALVYDFEALAGIDLSADWNFLAPGAESDVEVQKTAVAASRRLAEQVPVAPEVLQRFDASAPPAAESASVVEAISVAWNDLLRRLESPPAAAADWRESHPTLLGAIREALPAWSADAANGGFVQLGRWVRVRRQLTRLQSLGLDGLGEQLRSGALRADDVEPALRRGIARAALADRLSTTVLAGFDGIERDRAIERFAAGGELLRRDMVAELPAKIVADRSFTADRLIGRVGALNRELSRKRGGQKIRELFANYGPIIGELTPCLMMSPHSVARFLPADALAIDLVVFDEASQIRVAEAISAMGRAASTVVVGDSQQMPPTSIATPGAGADDFEPKESIEVPADMESVLSEAVESNLPRLWLSWHYRSRHEALISFSNHNYYEGRLASFPRPPEEESDLGVSWRRVDGSFERRANRVNRVEAEAIVEEIRSRLAREAIASIGVVTFNTQQRDLILDLLEESSDPLVAVALSREGESLFVKNLENVQGDERDVILFSLAFSPDPDTGKLPLNFGPLVQAGGERRLNVAVTRARAQVVLFSSFDPPHIDLSRSSSVGLAHLRSYLEMAQRQDDDPGVLRAAEARNWHRDEVVAGLTDGGLLVRTDVGLSDFTVDLAVSARPQGPWVAVFLDGPGYAKRRTVGDRESLPHGVLVGSMGWARVERVWLPDWLRDPEEAVGRIVRAASEPPTALPDSPAADDWSDGALASGRDLGRPDGGPEPRVGRDHLTFAPAHDRVVGSRETLDRLGLDPRADRAVSAQVRDVLEQEAPIEVTRLARIVARRFDLHRVAGKRVASIVALVPSGLLDRTAFGTFAWPEGEDPRAFDSFRRAGPEAPRTIEEIAPQEILNAMMDLARTGVGISRDELLRETALSFGVRRVAAKVRAHLEAVLEQGIRDGRFLDAGGAVTVA